MARAKPRLIGILLIVAAAAALALGGRPAAPRAKLDLVAHAKGSITTSSGTRAILRAANLAPGQEVRGQVTVRYRSSAPGRVRLRQRLRSEQAGRGGGRLADDLVLTIRQKRKRVTRTLYSGPMSGLRSVRLRRFRRHEKRKYFFAVSMPDHGLPAGPLAGDNAQQGASVTADYIWSANSLNRGPTPGGYR